MTGARGTLFAVAIANRRNSNDTVRIDWPRSALWRLRKATQKSGLYVDPATPLAAGGFIVTNRLAQTTVR
ncbi:MAG: hypothetical protein VCF24_11675, partial [Candidatus Latescibacterota bacterium]